MNANEYRSLLESFDLDALLSFLKGQAGAHFDGHYSILSFTTGFKVAFGTPDLNAGRDYNELLEMPSFPTLKEAVIGALITARSFYSDLDNQALSLAIQEKAVEQIKRVDAYDKMYEGIERYINEQFEQARNPKPGRIQPMISGLAGVEHVTHIIVDSMIAEGKFRDCGYAPSWLAGVAWEWLECLRPWRDKHFWPAVGESSKEQE